MQSISRSSTPAEARTVPTTQQALQAATALGVDAINSIVDGYIGHTLMDIRNPLQKQFELLDARLTTRVLNLMGTPWAVLLIMKGGPSGFGDFLDQVLELSVQRKFTGSLVDVFGDVVPRLLDMGLTNADALSLFVFRIGHSDRFSPLEKEQIIWGTQGAADPTTAPGGHWARAGQTKNGEMQAALLEGVAWVKRKAQPAEGELPPQQPAPCCTLL